MAYMIIIGGVLAFSLAVMWSVIAIRALVLRRQEGEEVRREVEVEITIRDEEPTTPIKIRLPYPEALSLRRYAERIDQAVHRPHDHLLMR